MIGYLFVRVQRQQSPLASRLRLAQGTGSGTVVTSLYLMKYGCPNNSSIVANRLLFNPAGEGPARTRAVQG